MLWFLVAVRIISNPAANVFQKILTQRGSNPRFVIAVSHALLSCLCLPFVFRLWPNSAEFWMAICTCSLLAVFGNAMLVEALKRTDLSVIGPINAYKSVVSLVPAMFLLGEVPGAWPLLGIALILVGSYFIASSDFAGPSATPFSRFFKDPGVQLRLGALILSAIEAVFLKRALLVSDAYTTFVFWSVLGFVVAAVWNGAFGDGLLFQWQGLVRNKSQYLFLAVMTGAMQLSTLLVMEHLPVSSALALFQTSALLSVFFGHAVFREPDLMKRLVGAGVMVAGACLIIIAR